jgi:hypothetical protein
MLIDAVSGQKINKNEYTYSNEGLRLQDIQSIWQNQWIKSSRRLYTYDTDLRLSDQILQYWKDSIWINSSLQNNYMYNDSEKVLQFDINYWKNNSWQLNSTDYSTYDESGNLIRRDAYYPTGHHDYQVFYFYTNGTLNEAYSQTNTISGWKNWWRILYTYNNCGNNTSQVRFDPLGNDWIRQTKTIFYNSFNIESYPGKKVPVCHNEHTIYISKNALKAHLAHGDCIGDCTVEKKPEGRYCDEKDKPDRPLFIIYPNPARDKITIKFNKDDCKDSKRVELTDFYGKLIKSFVIKDNDDLTIYRGNLPTGKYYIRLFGKEIHSAVVIFE